jgi:hypothetical protein
VAEVLSGDYYQPLSTNSPHQIWSAAMVISPMMRGMLGIESDARSHTLRFTPHVPAGWKSFSIDNVHAGEAALALQYQRSPGSITLEVKRSGSGECTLDFSPALSLRSSVATVELNGRSLPFRMDSTASDRHVSVHFPVGPGTNTLRMQLKNDFGVSYANELPALGSASEGLRLLAETWNSSRTQMTLSLSGLAGKTYGLSVWNPSEVASVRGGTLSDGHAGEGALRVEFKGGPAGSYVHQDVVLSFAKPR